MLKKLISYASKKMDLVETVEEQTRSHSAEIIGKYKDKNVIVNVSILKFPELPKEKGKLRLTKEGKEKYDLTKDELKFIKECYCHRHMNARQISKVSGIQQEAIYRHIRHDKLKPVHDKTKTKKQRNITFTDVEEFLK